MKKKVIKQGIILVKKDGIIYELDKKTFQTIKALIFDIDCDLCKLCSNTMCKSSKQIDNDFITDALTLKTKPNCEYVLGCTKHDPKDQYYDAPRLVWYNTNSEEMSAEEETMRHYSDAHVHHLIHPTVAKHINKIK